MVDPKPLPKDRRMVATIAIMGSALGMLALCVPLCLIVDMDSLPIWTIVSAAVATSSVWFFGKPKEVDEKQTKDIKALQASLQEMKERLENVEVMNRYEATLAEKTLAKPDSGSTEPERTMGPVSE